MSQNERTANLIRYLQVLLSVPKETTLVSKEIRTTILAINKELGLEII